MYFRNYGLRKNWLDKGLKAPVSDDPSISNMPNGPKHVCNMDDGTFTIFIDHSGNKGVEKSLFFSVMQNLKTLF